jgi:uncharacterized protein (DUF2062 family)
MLTSLRKHNWHKKLQRGAKYRLVVPLKRSKHPPEFTARGVAVGMLLAMTPTIGIQMFLIAGTWLFLTKVVKWDFSLLAGLGWTWTSNVFTMIPLYYLFYITGQLMLGNIQDISGFEQFADLVNSINNPDLSFMEKTRLWMVNLFRGWGIPMFLGSIPWAIFSSWLGYVIAYNYVVKHREKRAKRMIANNERQKKSKTAA